MGARTFDGKRVFFFLAVCLAVLPVCLRPETGTPLNREQKEEFLLNADVIRSRRIGKGITNPYRLTLSDGTLTHDAAFQPVFQRKNYMKFGDGRTEMNYVDSYLYNIAAYKIALLLGLEKMMPVTVERKWGSMIGSLSWWLPVQMDEGERLKKNIRPPDVEAYNRQIHRMRVFGELVYDTDRNVGNVLIGENWEVYMIDFSRAFRLYHKLNDAKNLQRCSRDLLARLRALDRQALSAATKGLLTDDEVEGVMVRRDLILKYFEKLIAEQGEEAVLY
jgi:hypothetical protein